MKFSINREVILKSLSGLQGVVERKNTLPILSNVLISVLNKKLTIKATDLEILFTDEISDVSVDQDGSTTTSASILYDVIRKSPADSKIIFEMKTNNKLGINCENSKYQLLCLSPENFPNFAEDVNDNNLELKSTELLKLLNKTKISMSNDDSRHYLNGVFFHEIEKNGKVFLASASTDGHRLSFSSIEIATKKSFTPFILPKKTVFQLIQLIDDKNEIIKIFFSDNKIKFKIKNTTLTSKVIDGKFPDYRQVVPKNNTNTLIASMTKFNDAIERVISVSLDKKEGIRLKVDKDKIELSVNSANTGEGNEIIDVNYKNDPLEISFNSRYLLEIASQIQDANIKMNFLDSSSPALIEDAKDKSSFFVLMPMKI